MSAQKSGPKGKPEAASGKKSLVPPQKKSPGHGSKKPEAAPAIPKASPAATLQAASRAMSPEELKLRKSFESSTLYRVFSKPPQPLPLLPAPSLEGLAVTLPPPEPVTEKELLERLWRALRQAFQRERQPGEKVAPGDELTVDVVGFCDGQVIPFTAKEQQTFVLGDPEDVENVPRFLHVVIDGLEVGKGHKVPVALPEDFPVEPLRGKVAVYAVQVLRAAEPPSISPESPEALERLGLGGSLDEVFQRLAAQIQEENAFGLQTLGVNRVLEQLAQRAQGPVPEELVDHLLAQSWWVGEGHLLDKFKLSGPDREASLKAWLGRADLREEVRRRISVTQALRAVAAAEKITLDADQLAEVLIEWARQMGISPREMAKEMPNDQALVDQLTQNEIYQRAINLVMQRAQVSLEAR